MPLLPCSLTGWGRITSYGQSEASEAGNGKVQLSEQASVTASQLSHGLVSICPWKPRSLQAFSPIVLRGAFGGGGVGTKEQISPPHSTASALGPNLSYPSLFSNLWQSPSSQYIMCHVHSTVELPQSIECCSGVPRIGGWSQFGRGW